MSDARVSAGQREPLVAGIAERPLLGHVNLRGDASDALFLAAMRSVLNVEPPPAPNTVAQAGDLQLAWLGPDEWLLSAPRAAQPAMLNALNDAFAKLHASATDLSDAYAVLVVEGADAAEILSADCPLDFHARAFAVGACAQSLVGKANVLFVREHESRFTLHVRRSFAAYACQLLCHAARLVRAAHELQRTEVTP